MSQIGKNIELAIDTLNAGQIIGLPTETVYGLAGNALNEDAILKIYAAKNRPKFDPLIAHVDSISKIESLVLSIPIELRKLMDAFWPGPLTVLLPRNDKIPDLLTSGLERVAFRIPNHPVALEVLKQLSYPLAAPSANPFGFVSPTSAQHVADQLGEKVSYILDGGECQVGIESTVVGMDDGKVAIYRLGGLTKEEIEDVIGEVHVQLNRSSNPEAPGMLKKHYSPGIPLVIGDIDNEISKANGKKIGVLSFSKSHDITNQIILSPRGDLNEAARGIFAALRKMRNSDVELIITQEFPDYGLGRAINDRLQRAAAQ